SWFSIFSLYFTMFLTPASTNFSYLSSISSTAHFKAIVAACGSVITGEIRCGIPLYGVNSTIFGSMSKNFTSFMFALYKRLKIIVLMHTLFPDPRSEERRVGKECKARWSQDK